MQIQMDSLALLVKKQVEATRALSERMEKGDEITEKILMRLKIMDEQNVMRAGFYSHMNA